MNSFLILVAVIAIISFGYMLFNFFKVKKLEEGPPNMQEIASAIRVGANTFLFEEYKVLVVTVGIVTVVLAVFIQLPSAVAFIIGMIMSSIPSFIGMRAGTYGNVRTTNVARVSEEIGATYNVAFRGGSVMGTSVGSSGLIGFVIVLTLFQTQINNLNSIINWCGINYVPLIMTISSYSLGCSIVALFNRVGGGIFTKAADVGADTVGKTELNLPEDDPRNPAVIADNTGDLVGDIAGLGADLNESYVGAMSSAVMFIIALWGRFQRFGYSFPESLFTKLFYYPIVFCALGLLSCILGLIYIFNKKASSNPRWDLNAATWMSAGITALLNLIMTLILFNKENLGDLPFRFGAISPFASAVFGMIAGILIGELTEYYTSDQYRPTQEIAEAAKHGPAENILKGLSVGMISCGPISTVIILALLAAYLISGEYGIAMAAVGMLSFVAITVSVDSYGPISDNAGGIAEMAGLSKNVRAITDKLDSIGNTTAAMGKGFAIGSAAFATTAMLTSYVLSYSTEENILLNIINPLAFGGALFGGCISFYFSGLLTKSVSNTADKMVDEIRRQFNEIAGLREGTVKPDYKQCVAIATRGALSEMRKPALIALLVPVISGFCFGPDFVAGILVGSTITSVMLAIFTGNCGGAWDNAKKMIEEAGLKGSLEHIAATIGDTVGDPLKDTVGPSLDILMKIMAVTAIIMVSIYGKYNLVVYLSQFI